VARAVVKGLLNCQAINCHIAKLPGNKGIMDFAHHKDWVDTTLNVEKNGALISSDFKPFKLAKR